MADEELKLETKCYDANEYGYLYGLNQKIPDEEFEKCFGRKADKRRKLYNGMIKCQLYMYYKFL